MTENNNQELDFNLMFSRGKAITSDEALSEITPIDWSNDTLAEKYRNSTIIKSKEEEDK